MQQQNHPVQALAAHSGRFIVAAIGPLLRNVDLETGKICAEWIRADRPERNSGGHRIEHGYMTRLLESSKDAVIAACDDKVIRVFIVDANDGTWRLEKTEHIAKRPSCLAALGDDNQFIVGDLFGDVFRFNIDSSAKQDQKIATVSSDRQSNQSREGSSGEPVERSQEVQKKDYKEEQNEKPFKQSADQAKEHQNDDECDDELFPESLILGHFSTVTDLKVVLAPSDSNCQSEAFIASADTDEHIRISRWREPYIIETFLLKHKEFVGTMAQLPWAPKYMLSAGGDDNIFLWDWQHGKLCADLNLMETLTSILRFSEIPSSTTKTVNTSIPMDSTDATDITETAEPRNTSDLPAKIACFKIVPLPVAQKAVVLIENVPYLPIITLRASDNGGSISLGVEKILQIDGSPLSATIVSVRDESDESAEMLIVSQAKKTANVPLQVASDVGKVRVFRTSDFERRCAIETRLHDAFEYSGIYFPLSVHLGLQSLTTVKSIDDLSDIHDLRAVPQEEFFRLNELTQAHSLS